MLATAPLISVVIPVHNAQNFLAVCLSSVVAQAGPFKLQVIVVDDGSTDTSPEIARQHVQVICLQQPNLGPSAARNAGIAMAQGEFIAFLDADDLWPPDKLAVQLSALTRQPEAALVFGDCRQFDATGPWQRTQFESDGLGIAAWGEGATVPCAYSRLLHENFITTGSVLVRRSVLVELGGFAENLRLVEDLELWLRIARRYPIAWCDPVCLYRRRHGANTSQDAEAMGLAYLEVLSRQTKYAHGSAGAAIPELKRLQACEYQHLAALALSRGAAPAACQRAFRAIATRFSWRAAWLLCRASTMLLRQRYSVARHRA